MRQLKSIYRRLVRRSIRPAAVVPVPRPDFAAHKRTYERMQAEFRERTAGMNWPGLEHFCWYHTVDLGNGLVTPGAYDFRGAVEACRFPSDMSGLRALDVGAATGFYSFELERRGAEVTAVELPSIERWDLIEAERADIVEDIAKAHQAATPHEGWQRHLGLPFEFCKQQLGSRVERRLGAIYDLSPHMLGDESFDWIVLGDILLHLMNPIQALDRIVRLCKGTLVVISDLMPIADEHPMFHFAGNMNTVDRRSWWVPNRKGLVEMLRRVGFSVVEEVGELAGVERHNLFAYRRAIFHCRRK